MLDFKHTIKIIYWNVKLFSNTFNKNTKSCILLYHGVVPNNAYAYNMRFITQKLFESHLLYFKKHANLVSVNDILTNKIKEGEINIAISFDDGYKNNYQYAMPILNKLNIPATFYITTAKFAGYDYLWADYLDIACQNSTTPKTINGITFTKNKGTYTNNTTTLKSFCKDSDWSFKLAMFDAFTNESVILNKAEVRPYWELMSEEEIYLLSKNNLFTVGSHGVYHNCLTALTIADAITEMQLSKHHLEQIIQKPITQMAYPDGRFNEDLITAISELGFSQQLLVDSPNLPINAHIQMANRLVVNPYLFGKQQFNAILNNGYN